MKKILITGATGFIGSHLVEKCISEGYSVVAFDRYNSNNNWGWLEYSDYKNEFEVVLGDIRDYDLLYNTMKNCDSVFHLAALIGIPYSYQSPIAYLKTNIEGTYNVLESSKNLNIDQLLITSTSETYGSAQYVPIDEAHPIVGQSPYSASKIGADQLAISYFRSFNTPVKIVRPFNTYGPRQSSRAIIPSLISQIIKGNKKIEVGSLSPRRDFTFVEDTVSGFISISKSSKLFGEVINIGMKKDISIEELIIKIKNLMKSDVIFVSKENRIRPENSEVNRLLCDNSKIINNTEWKPKYSLNEGLALTIDWINENIEHFKTENYNT
tara:strand:+ start:364 stop:1338 length:975 start_codon:yes stop_codon:yes gene_type:complete